MKSVMWFCLLLLLAGCSSSKEEETWYPYPPGYVPKDIIGLTTHSVKISTKGGSKEVKTKMQGWSLVELTIDGVLWGKTEPDCVKNEKGGIIAFNSSTFQIAKTDSGLRIQLSPIAEDEKRVLRIVLHNGNYHDYLTVTQE